MQTEVGLQSQRYSTALLQQQLKFLLQLVLSYNTHHKIQEVMSTLPASKKYFLV